MGVLEIHPWGSRNDVDGDAGSALSSTLILMTGIEWKQLVTSAFEVRDLLAQLGLESFVKIYGRQGDPCCRAH